MASGVLAVATTVGPPPVAHRTWIPGISEVRPGSSRHS
jgi:hypothetical protein